MLKIGSFGKVLGFEKKDKIFFLYGEKENLKIEVIKDKIIRFHFSKDKEWKKKFSFAIEKELILIDAKVEEKEKEILIVTSELKISMNKEDGKIKIFDKGGNLILSDYENLGYKRFKNKIYCYKEIRNEIAFLGFGERTGSLNKKGKRLINWNTDEPHHYPTTDPLYQSHPFFISWNPKRSYGIFFDNTYRSYFDMGKENERYWYFESEGGELKYYFIYGPTPKEVIEGYTKLIGRYYMPPIWALGYQQSRWSYESEEKVREIAKNFREKGIPCDVIYLDIDYMDGYRVFTIDEERFPNFEKMIKELREEGFKVVVIIDPGVKRDVNYGVYKEGIEKGYFCKRSSGEVYIGHVWPGECAFPDFVKEEVRKWWGEKQKKLMDLGVSGFWNDMNEPASFSHPISPLLDALESTSTFWGKVKDQKEEAFYLKTFARDVLHGDKNYTHDEIHNVYGLLMAKASYEGWRRYSEKRPLIISRAGFSGIQKYSAVWTGDNKSSWEHLYMSIPMLQNLSLSGIPFVGADVGGFGEDCTPELFIRWIELGIFYPFFRNHSAINTRPQEPWTFGKEVEKVAKRYITLRYQLIPYLYSLFWISKEKGIPPIRSLILEYPEDPESMFNEDEFLFGPNLLVAPIYREGMRVRSLYLPKGGWYNFWTEERLEGPNYFVISAPLEIIPIFVKEGSIIPMWEPQNYVEEKSKEVLNLRIYKGEGEFIYYEDDGISWNYEKGEYNLIKFKLKENKLHIEYIYKGYNSERKLFRIIPLKGRPIEVEDKGENIVIDT